jgi:hypothetical protein
MITPRGHFVNNGGGELDQAAREQPYSNISNQANSARGCGK